MKKLRLRGLTCPRPLGKEFIMGLLTIVWINHYTVLLESFPARRSHHLKKIERTARAGIGGGGMTEDQRSNSDSSAWRREATG